MGEARRLMLGTALLLLQLISHVQGDYCSSSLAKKTCPSLQTVDSIDLKAYGGKWYEIGSTANFKNSFEAGGTCAVAQYTAGEKELKVENSHFMSAKPMTTVSVAGISSSCSLVCQSARSMCSQVKDSNSLLRKGISKVWEFKNSIDSSFSSEAGLVSTANAKIEAAADGLAPRMDALVRLVNKIQSSNSVMSQTDGGADYSTVVASIKATISLASAEVTAVDAAFKTMSDAQLDLIKVAETLFKKGGSGIGPSFTLTDAATQVLAGIGAVKAQATAMSAALEVSSKAAAAVLEDKSKAFYNVSKIVGKASQNSSSEGGKLSVTFDPLPGKLFPGKYWILAVDGESSAGYSAALVYSCMELLTGGTDETLWILSRSPSLAEATTSKLLGTASSMGLEEGCNGPFVNTVRSSNCPA